MVELPSPSSGILVQILGVGLSPKVCGVVLPHAFPANTVRAATWCNRLLDDPLIRVLQYRGTVEKEMTETGTLNGQSQKMLEEKLLALEARFAALETGYQDLYKKSFSFTESESTSPSIRAFPSQLLATNEVKERTEVSWAPQRSIDEKFNTEKQLDVKKINPTSRVKVTINRTDLKTGERKDYPPCDAEPSPAPNASIAFSLREHVVEDEEAMAEIDIITPYLWNLLKDLLGHCPQHLFRGSPVTIQSSFKPLVLYWDKLGQAARDAPKNDNDRQARSGLKLLLDTIFSSSDDSKLDKYFRARNSNKEQ